MAGRLRAYDWCSSDLDSPQRWPQSLRSVVNVMLGSGFPMFVAWGPSLSMLYNDAYSQLLGDKHPGALGQPFYDVWCETKSSLVPLVERALGGNAFFEENLPLRLHRRGFDEDAWFTFSYSPVHDEAGSVAGIFCTCTETTAGVLLARRQQAELQRLQILFNQAPGFMAVLRGPTHVFEIANPAYLKITGFRDILGKPIHLALPEIVEQGFIKLLDDVYQSGKPFVGQSLRVRVSRVADAPLAEVYVDFVCQPLLSNTGQVDGILVQGHEVTEQHRSREALLVFSNSIPAIAWVAFPDGLVERFNSQWEAYTGQATNLALGNGWLRALHPNDRQVAWQAWDEARHGKQPWQVEYRLRRHDGIYRWCHARVVPQLDAGGEVVRWFGTTTDIDDARSATQSLRDADRQKDEFLATLAHELRNPLAPIRTAVQLLAAPTATPAVRARAVDVIGRQVRHMTILLDDLIDIARVTQRRMVLRKEWVAVDAIVQAAVEAAQPLVDAKGHTLTVDAMSPLSRIEVDPVRLTQVLCNLLNNAAKYTDPGGAIDLIVKPDDGCMLFAVVDNGIGLSAQAVRQVFTMFAQEKSAIDRTDGGLGIGLALAKGLTELHGGSLRARSGGLNLGSRFEVRIPLNQPACPDRNDLPSAITVPTALPPRMCTILLADDNLDAVDALADLVRMDGHTVHTAPDGVQAAAMALKLQPDVLVLDIGMPGMNGYEVARRIRAQSWGKRAYLVAATGWGQDHDRQQARDAGFDLHLTKPFNPLELIHAISQHAGTMQPESAIERA